MAKGVKFRRTSSILYLGDLGQITLLLCLNFFFCNINIDIIIPSLLSYYEILTCESILSIIKYWQILVRLDMIF